MLVGFKFAVRAVVEVVVSEVVVGAVDVGAVPVLPPPNVVVSVESSVENEMRLVVVLRVLVDWVAPGLVLVPVNRSVWVLVPPPPMQVFPTGQHPLGTQV